MNMKNFKFSTKLIVQSAVAVIGLVVLSYTSYSTISLIKINGPIYKEIVMNKDLVADILPPPEYILESFFVVHELSRETDGGRIRKKIEALRKLRSDYDVRHEFWKKNLPEGPMKTQLCVDSYQPAVKFYEIVEREFVPAVLNGQRERASELINGALKNNYEQHRSVIDQVVELANSESASVEKNANGTIRNRYLVFFLFTGGLVILIGLISFAVFKSIQSSVLNVLEMIKDVAEGEGDLTKKIEVHTQDELGELARWFNLFIDKLHGIIVQIANTTVQAATASQEASASSEQLASGTEEQQAQTAQVATSMEEMSATVQEVAKNANEAAVSARGAGETATKGGAIMRQTIEGIQRIADSAMATSGAIKVLTKNSEKIGDIIGVIDDVADQTNLLALNAAIEAARAGDQGRGFAVVADEVRKLAERTSSSTKEIAAMVKAMQEGTVQASGAMEQGMKDVEKGVQLAEQAAATLEEIVASAQKVVDLIQQVATAAEEQSAAAEEISSNVASVSSVSKQSAQGVQQIAAAAQEVAKLADGLQSLVNKFKLRSGSVKQA